MQLPIIITTNVTQEELSIIAKQSLLKQFKYLKYFFYIGVPLILLNTFTLLQAGAHWTNYLRIAIFLSVLILLWVFMPKLIAKNIYQQKKSDFEHSTYTFSEESLSLESATIKSTLRWDGFQKVEKDKNFLWLFIAKTEAYTLPIRCFDNKETLEAVYQLVQAKIK